MRNTTKKILVVDDEPDLEPLVLQRMRRNIRRGEYEFVFAHDGVEALEMLMADKEIDLVVSDINMPRMDGLTLLQQIQEVTPDIRAIIISAYGDMENIRTAMNRGAFDFVTKPLDFQDLRLTIQRTLQHLDEWRDALQSRDKLVALQNELDVANNIQQSVLPASFPLSDQYEIYGSMQPARNVGGDFFDVQILRAGKIGLAIADVSDKGMPAALFMMSSRMLLKGAGQRFEHPGEALAEVNDLLDAENEASMFVTLFYAIYNPENSEFRYANGGHNEPIVVHPDGRTTIIDPTGGTALGILPGLEYRESMVKLESGDTVILYTDGITEAFNAEGELFGMDRLRQVFQDKQPMNAQEASAMVFDAVNEFAGDEPQSDDQACLVFRHA
ncbi:MAG: SpoIIE family protein phosphatase [Chloroflexi bacterium]|nr:SpoIIE family protein phosphatase [Chloroflexota bacterium]